MRSLRFLTIGDDADTVVVADTDGEEQFVLEVDDRLRDAVAPAAPEPDEGEPVTVTEEPPPPIALSPREIQVRVRAGESPEELARDTGADLTKVMRFATAVLAERARVGDEARRSRARRDGDGALVPFGETVDRRFAFHGIEPASVVWDSYRRDDGSWVVIAAWSGDGSDRRAHWAFSLAARTLLPADEAAADLLSDRPLRPVVQAVPDEPDTDDATRPLPTSVGGSEVFDQEADDSAGYFPPERPGAQPATADLHRPEPAQPEPQRADSSRSQRRNDPPPLRLADPLPIFGDIDPADEDLIPFEVQDDVLEDPAHPAEPPPPVRRGSGRSKAAREQ
ncbi:MAG: septation protein SepH, partial [Jatrophihabitans sp.]